MSKTSSRKAGWLAPEIADFKPGLLAIQQSPPPRLPRAVFYVVGVLFSVMLAWALIARLDIVAVAPGRLVPESYTKIVQPAEPGIVKEVLVKEGDEVAEGQVLIRLDPTISRADSLSVASDLAFKRLALRRIDAELKGVPLALQAQDDPPMFNQVQTQAQANRQSYLDALAQETSALERSSRDMQAAQETLSKLRATSPLAEQTAAAHRSLVAEGFVSAVTLNHKEREAIEQRQDLKAQMSTVLGLEAAVAAQQKKVATLTSQYRNKLYVERTEVMGQLAKLEQESRKSEFKNGLLELKAPQAGIVKDIATTTLGAVVQPGMVLLTLVPKGERLVAEVQVRNEDVGLVQAGQAVRLKVAAYPFQKHGLIDARVQTLAADAQTADGNGQRTGIHGYKAILSLDPPGAAGGARSAMRLESGMQVVAEINQGQRTVMEYLLSPVEATLQSAARER